MISILQYKCQNQNWDKYGPMGPTNWIQKLNLSRSPLKDKECVFKSWAKVESKPKFKSTPKDNGKKEK